MQKRKVGQLLRGPGWAHVPGLSHDGDSPPDEGITVIFKPSGHRYIYGPDDKVQRVVERLKAKGIDVIIVEEMGPCI